MSANKKTNKPDALLLRVMREIHKTAETPDKGFRTVDQWAEHWGLKRSRSRIYVLKAVELGIMEKRLFRVIVKKGTKPYPTAHYGEKARQRRT